MSLQPTADHTPLPADIDYHEAREAPGVRYEPLGLARSVLVIVYCIVAVWYLTWRLTTFNPQAMTFSIVLYGAEVYGFVVALMHIFMVWRLTVREAPVVPLGLTVDVFVATFNEPVPMLRRTLIAATRMDYPHQTWLLDDGNRPEMKELAESLGCRYLARTQNTDAKAGNLNNALTHSLAEFVAVFDADHAPSRDFLRRTLGYFRDDKIAFVQTPQDFYNLDSFQHRRSGRRRLVWTEQSLFFRVIQRGKDYWNAAFFCGSCAILRRRALDEVKGFATGTVTEDLETSVRLHRKGFASVYHSESLAYGIAPATVAPFLRQRVRWGQGAMQALRGGGILFGSGLTFAQRINYLATVSTYFDGWQKAVFYISPVIVLVTGVMPIAEVSWLFLVHFIPFYVLTFWAFEEVGRGYGRTIIIEQYNMARFAAFVWSTFGLVKRKLDFRVTPKTAGRPEESRRWIIPQGAILLFNVVAIPVGIFITWMNGILPTGALIANIVWAAVNASLAQAVLGFSTRLAHFRRREYRFPIPVPTLLEFSGSAPVIGVLDDVSGLGFKYYGRFPVDLQPGALLSGELDLPSGKLPFRAEVRTIIHAHGSERHPKALGCEFHWARQSDEDELDAFLYGSDLQWRLNRLGEQTRTPLEWMSGEDRFRKRAVEPPSELWASALSRPLGSESAPSHISLISVPADRRPERRLISFRRLPVDEPLEVVVVTRTGNETLEGPCELTESIGGAGTPLYLYRLNVRNQTQNR